MTTRLVDVLQSPLAAGITSRLSASGRFFVLMESGGPVSISFLDHLHREIGSANNISAGFKAPLSADFTSLQVTSATDQIIKYACGVHGVDYNRITGQVLIAGPGTLVDMDPAAVGTAASLIAASDSARKMLTLCNPPDSAGILAVGGPGVTFAGAVYFIEPGDTLEFPAPSAAVYGVFEGTAGTVNVLGGV